MRKVRKTMLLAISTVVVVAIVIASTIGTKPTVADSLKLYSVRSLGAVDEGDYLQISFGIGDEAGQPTFGNGTASLLIKDNTSRTLYSGTFQFAESDFGEVSTSNGVEQTVVCDLSYEGVNRSFAQGGSITCILNLTSKEWVANATQVTIPLPSALSVADLFFRTAMPSDQEYLMAANEIQGGVTYEPHVSDVVHKGLGKVLLRSSEIWPDHPSYVLILDRSWAASNPDLAARVVRAHMDAEVWIQNALANPNSSEYNHLIEVGMNISNKSAAVIEDALQDIDFSYNLTNVSKSYVKEYVDSYIEEGLVSNQSLEDLSYQNSDEFANASIDTHYISLALNISQTTSIVGNVSIGFVKGNLFMLPTYIALDKSLWGGRTAFERYGVEVNSPEPSGFKTNALVTRAVLTGEIDVGFTGICPAILMRANLGMDTIMAAQMTAEGTALVVQDGISSLGDLAGKTIASVDPVTIQNLFMMHIAEKYGFRLIPVDLGNEANAAESLTNGTGS